MRFLNIFENPFLFETGTIFWNEAKYKHILAKSFENILFF